jgi:D-glycero-D-manno-heptose 1,7-bisphosphate phosphatase
VKKNPNKQPAVFVDRDGTLIEEVDYLSTVEMTRLFPFTRRALIKLKESGFLIIVATNQSGIGRGIFEESAMHDVHAHLSSQLEGLLDAFYFCPHLPCDGCDCRKPLTGMVEAAMTEFDIDIAGSWMIGDKKSDVEMGKNAGMGSALVLTGYGRSEAGDGRSEAGDGHSADIVAQNLGEAVDEILRRDRNRPQGE